MAQYLFKHYEPFSIINGRQIWLERGIRVPERWARRDMPAIARRPENYEIHKLPLVLGREGGRRFSTVKAFAPVSFRRLQLDFNLTGAQPDQYLELGLKPLLKRGQGIIAYRRDEKLLGRFTFEVLECQTPARYLIPLSSQYNWFSASGRMGLDIGGVDAGRLSRVRLLQEVK